MPWGVTADTDQNESVTASGASDGAQTLPGAERMGQVVTAEMHQDRNIAPSDSSRSLPRSTTLLLLDKLAPA